MELRLNITDLQNPNDILALKKAISTMADECDVLYSESELNGYISARIGRRGVWNNGGTKTYWVNTDGSTAWRQLTDSANEMWVVDGTETQLRTADEIDMQSKKIINVLNPTLDQDAATKKYHDDDIAAEMNITTGHDHDGTDSKKVLASNLDGTGLTNGHVLYNNNGVIAGKAEQTVKTIIAGDVVVATGAGTQFYSALSGGPTNQQTLGALRTYFPVAGTLKNLYIYRSEDNSYTTTVYKNGSATAITIGDTTQAASDTEHTVAVAAGDYFEITYQGLTPEHNLSWSIEFDPS